MSLSDSPFTNRLNTNYVPSPSEILQIRSLLVDPTEEITRIDGQIEEMELALAQLKAKRALLLGPIDAHRALISPMRLIPHDILLEIFSACLPSKHNALIDPTQAPLLLGRICRHWRSVAYSAPMLWSSIHIPPLADLSMPPNTLSGLQRLVETWFERSGACPLSVSFFEFMNYPESNSDLEKHLLAPQILAASQRLHCLSLAGDAQLLRPILQLGPGHLPALKTFRMKTSQNQALGSTNILELPTLENVALSISTDPLPLPLPWSRLRILRLECYSRWTPNGSEGGLDFDGALDVLRRCPNLERCEMRITKYSQHSDFDPSQIILPQLHTLLFSGWEFQLHKWIDLVAPNLRSLQIGDLNVPSSPSWSSYGHLSADIDFTRFTSMTSLREFLQSFPTMAHLHLGNSYQPPGNIFPVDDEFIALLGPPHNLCPMLTDFRIMIPLSGGFSDAAVLAFIKARMTLPIPLRRFEVFFNRPMELDVMPELQSFIKEGLQVNLQYAQLRRPFNAREGLDEPGSLD
ncbi:F-box domain-containing protein [Mycena sanguinolenta]|uniref:F-box domain-containing protein n=1 Tax=Mycena sanguinolenta TaxID=230812 RepID=A0A8H6XU56_9AGAR|nr:F-box domain-containing protein [Mycena sanguinolenta]